MKRIFLIIFLWIPLFAAHSSSGTFHIWGRITDHGFSPVRSFSITVSELNPAADNTKKLQDFTVIDDNGEFLIKNLSPGIYLIEITVINYTKYSFIKKIINKNESAGEIVLQNTW